MKQNIPWLLLLALPVFAAESDYGPFAFELRPNSFEERCFKLESGQSLRYRFSATQPLDFNIHHHRGNDVFYPVKKANVRERNDRFRAKHADGYCLMWENRGKEDAVIKGAVEAARKL
jgi:hypothetical protein